MKHFFVLLSFFILTLSIIGYSQVVNSGSPQEPEPMLKKSNPPFFRTTVTVSSLPKTMSYQGLLSTAMGTPVPDGNYDLQFDLYDSSAAGTSQWTETHTGVAVHRGTFSIILGATSSLNIDFNRKLYVEVKATNGPVGPSYPLTFSPRSEMTSAPSSLAPWASNGSDIYFNSGHVGIGTTTPGLNGIGTLKLEIADSNGSNSDVAVRVAGGGNGQGYGVFNFAKSRGSLSAPSVVNNGDGLGGIIYAGYNGSSYQYGGSILGTVDSVPVSGAMPSRLDFYTTNVHNYWRETMTLDRNGRLGIGTIAPLSQLHVRGPNPVRILGDILTLGGSEYVDFMARNTSYGTDIGGMRIRRDSITGDVNTSIYAAATGFSASEKMRIAGNGNVGIGTTSPAQFRLNVQGDGDGIYGLSAGINGRGITGEADNGSGARGVYGFSSSGYGVYGATTSGYAGYFSGDVHVAGTLSKTAGSFKIDHPTDPANKYLYHSFVESPDMKNIYDGVVTTNANGEAVVTLPDWFGALNKDFRYQLTVIGEFAQAIISKKIQNNQFSIKTDKPNVEVSWQVTGIRQDAYANAHRLPVEELKSDKERGYYEHPELFGQPEEKGIEWAHHPEMMMEMKAKRLQAEKEKK